MEQSYEGALAHARAAEGPLSPHLEAFASSLLEKQYAPRSVCLKIYRAADFSSWLGLQAVDPQEADERTIASYHLKRTRGGQIPWRAELSALHQLLAFLRERGVVNRARVSDEALPADLVVHEFKRHLHHVRGLANRTIALHAANVREFLIERFGRGRLDLHELRAAEVIDFVQRRARNAQPHELKRMISALRSFLRFAQSNGDVGVGIVAAVPALASWSSTPALPRAISAEHARRAIEACDPHTVIGRRDRAILLLLARLGLRAAEVSSLMLDDVDWDAGRVRVRGKGAREAWMPLPVDARQAIVAYLQAGRPRVTDRHLFLRAYAPVRGFTNGTVAVDSIVAHALGRAGIDSPRKGAHQFRHALATQMLHDGASLAEIGQLLRHRSPQTTALYARVDLGALRALAVPWPGGAR